MLTSVFRSTLITGVAAAVSSKWRSLDSFRTGSNDDVIDRFKDMIGVQGRYDAGLHQTASDFCYAAASALLKEKSLAPSEIGALVFVTQTPDYGIPATACVLHYRLGLSTECIALDVNMGCSGYVYGLNIIASLMETSNIEKALLLVGDTSAKERSPVATTNITNSDKMLFGDSGSATLLEKRAGAPVTKIESYTDGSGFRSLIMPNQYYRHPVGHGSTRMDDVAVFQFTLSEVPKMIKGFLEREGKTQDDFDSLILHQANLYILKQIAKRAKFPWEKVPLSIGEFGNTSCASIPVTLVNAFGKEEKSREIQALMCGFGVGLSWAIASTALNTADILPLIHTDEYFDDELPEWITNPEATDEKEG